MQLRLIEQRTAQHGSRRHDLLVNPHKPFAEALGQPSLDPDAEVPDARKAVVLHVLHAIECRMTEGEMSSPWW